MAIRFCAPITIRLNTKLVNGHVWIIVSDSNWTNGPFGWMGKKGEREWGGKENYEY